MRRYSSIILLTLGLIGTLCAGEPSQPASEDGGREPDRAGKGVSEYIQRVQERFHAIPLITNGKALYVKLAINGKPAYFLIDSASQSLLLAKELAEEYGCELVAAEQVANGLGGRLACFHAKVTSLEMGVVRFATQQIQAISMPGCRTELRTASGETFRKAGIIGNNVLRQMKASIDYGYRCLLIPRKGVQAELSDLFTDENSLRVPLALKGGYHYLDVSLGNDKQAQLIVDSGCEMMVLSKAFCERSDLPLEGGQPGEKATGVDGKAMGIFFTRPPAFKIANRIQLSMERIPVVEMKHVEVAEARQDGLFGFNMLSQLKAVYSLNGNCLFVRIR